MGKGQSSSRLCWPHSFPRGGSLFSPRLLPCLQKMWKLKQEECPECDVLSLGTYTAIRSFHGIADKVDVKTWKSTEHNMGLALTRDAYQKLIECTDTFCTYDDYNWDWTLQYLTVSCLPKFWKVLVPQVPRIFHAGAVVCITRKPVNRPPRVPKLSHS